MVIPDCRILQQVRTCTLSAESVTFVSRLARPLPPVQGIEATRLHARNVDVDAVNQHHLEQLPGEPVRFVAQDGGPRQADMDQYTLAPRVLDLKIGAQVHTARRAHGAVCLCVPDDCLR